MGDGLKRAILTTLRTRSWSGTGGVPVDAWTLTGNEIVAYYEAIHRGDEAAYLVIGCTAFQERKADRANQILKKAGLLRFDKTSRSWRPT